MSYLNAKPLYYGLADAAPEVSLSMDVPSRLADRLAAIGAFEYKLRARLDALQAQGFTVHPVAID